VRETFQRHDVAVANHFLDRLFEWKNMRQTVIMARLFAALLMVPVLLAHHSTAEYDLTRPASVAGVVTRFEWSNPHAHIYVDAASVEGAVKHWIVEIDSPNALQRQGWSRESLKPGDRVTCSGARAKDGSPRMRCTQVELADGTLLRSF
jgi:hypothetical protein